MEIEITTLNDKIRKLLAFHDDMTVRVEEHGLAVSLSTALSQGLAISEYCHGEAPENGAKPHSFNFKKTDDGMVIFPSTVSNYDIIKDHLLQIKFTDTHDMTRNIATLKSWEKMNLKNKENAKLLAYTAYIDVLDMMSNGTILNGDKKTPRNVAEQGVKPGVMNRYAPTFETLTYMNSLFDEYDQVKSTKPRLDTRVKPTKHFPFSFSRNPVYFGLQIMGLLVALLFQIELVFAVIRAFDAPRHMLPLVAHLPTIGIIAMAAGIVAIGCAAMIRRHTTLQHKHVQPSLPLAIDTPFPSMKITISDEPFLFESKQSPTGQIVSHYYGMQNPAKLIVEPFTIPENNKYSIN